MANPFDNGTATVTNAGTPVPLSQTSQVCHMVTIQPIAANAGAVYVGGPTVPQGGGITLNPGDTMTIQNDVNMYNLAAIYVNADNNNDGVEYDYGVR